jgi:hypothetical protein
VPSAPWRLKFAVDAADLYKQLYPEAVDEAERDTLGWLAAAGFGYQALRAENGDRSRKCRGCPVPWESS